MDTLRKYLWVWVIVGIILSSAMIIFIFLLINKCLSRRARGKHRLTQLQKGPDFNAVSNKYQTRQGQDTPPLPPRTQLLLSEAKSFGNLAEAPDLAPVSPDNEQETHNCVQDGNDYEEIPEGKQETHNYEEETHDYEQDIHDYEQDIHDYEQDIHDYEQDVHDYEQDVHDYEQDVHDYEEETHDYEQDVHDYEEETHDYEQDVHSYEESIPDYVEVEDELPLPPPPPPTTMCPDVAEDNTSTEDYDDIGGEDGLQSDEDYDDVA